MNWTRKTTKSARDENLYYETLFPIPRSVIDRGGNEISLSESKWNLYSESRNVVIDWNALKIRNNYIFYTFKLFIALNISRHSPLHIENFFKTQKAFSTFFKKFSTQDMLKNEEELIKFISDALSSVRGGGQEYRFWYLKYWYQWCADMDLPYFSPEVALDLDHIKIKGNEKGQAVLSEDLEKGPLTDSEDIALRKALIEDQVNGNIQEQAIAWLCIQLGCNPLNIALLREEDLVKYESKDKKNIQYTLKVPRIKKRDPKNRTEFKERKIDSRLGKLLEKNIRENQKKEIPEGWVRALLSSKDAKGCRIMAGHYKLAFQYTASDISQRLKKYINRLKVISPETGKLLQVTPRRLRYSFATKLVAQGAPPTVVAELLDHTDLQHVMVYFNSGQGIIDRLNKIETKKYKNLVEMFLGKIIVSKERDPLNPFVMWDRDKKMPKIGACGSKNICFENPPLSCYLCPKFEAFADANHKLILEQLIEWRSEYMAKSSCISDLLVKQLDRVIIAIKSLVGKIEGAI